MIDIGRAAQHPFEDQNWISRFLIGGLINIVPILNFAGFGYAIDHLKSVSRGQDIPLPTWDDLGAKFVTGLKLAVVNLILALPMFVIVCVASVLPALGAGAGDAGNDAIAAAFLGTSTVLLCVVGVYGLALALLAPAIYIQLARTDTIAACLRLGELWAIARRNLGDYILSIVVLIAAGIVIGVIVGVINIIPCIGQIVTLALGLLILPYLQVLSAHLFGQYARQG